MISQSFLHCDAGARRKMVTLSKDRFPSEVCGLIFGRQLKEWWDVLEVRELKNATTNNQARHFQMDPLSVWCHIRRSTLDFLGFWHSHPHASAQMSFQDLKWAWPECLYGIVSSEDDIRYWKMNGHQWQEVTIL